MKILTQSTGMCLLISYRWGHVPEKIIIMNDTDGMHAPRLDGTAPTRVWRVPSICAKRKERTYEHTNILTNTRNNFGRRTLLFICYCRAGSPWWRGISMIESTNARHIPNFSTWFSGQSHSSFLIREPSLSLLYVGLLLCCVVDAVMEEANHPPAGKRSAAGTPRLLSWRSAFAMLDSKCDRLCWSSSPAGHIQVGQWTTVQATILVVVRGFDNSERQNIYPFRNANCNRLTKSCACFVSG